MKGGVNKIFNFIKSKGVSNKFIPKNERNKSSDFKTQQKRTLILIYFLPLKIFSHKYYLIF